MRAEQKKTTTTTSTPTTLLKAAKTDRPDGKFAGERYAQKCRQKFKEINIKGSLTVLCV